MCLTMGKKIQIISAISHVCNPVYDILLHVWCTLEDTAIKYVTVNIKLRHYRTTQTPNFEHYKIISLEKYL